VSQTDPYRNLVEWKNFSLASARQKESLCALDPKEIPIPFGTGYEISGSTTSKGDLDLTAVSALWGHHKSHT